MVVDVCVFSFPELWIPFLRESPAAKAAKVVVMGDVVTCPGGLGLDEEVDCVVYDRARAHTHTHTHEVLVLMRR
jgi:hypothetical protein